MYMENNTKPLPDGLNVIMHIIQKEPEGIEKIEEVNDECQNTEES